MKSKSFLKEIYVNNKPLVLTNSAENYLKKNAKAAEYLLLSGAFARNLKLAKRHLETVSGIGAMIHDSSAEALEDLLTNELTGVKAAGGLVVNSHRELLMIYRRGNWDLPKGKMDEGESEVECAVREVAEETGVEALVPKEKLKSTFHIYDQDGDTILKTTEWYLMHVEGRPSLHPRLDEDIICAKWVTTQEASILIQHTYPIIRELVEEFFLD